MGVDIEWHLEYGPLFVAFDCLYFQKLIPNHLRDHAKMPSDVINFREWCICV